MRRSPPSRNDPPPSDEALAAALGAGRPDQAGSLCPVDRLPRRLRNQICIAVITVGLLNYLAYTLAYAALGGDAHNGHRAALLQPDGSNRIAYFVRGHFIHSLTGREREVSRGAWIYSYLHSISIPVTWGAVLISMLVLARQHILATMRGGWVSGQTFIAAFGTVVVLVSLAVTFLFTWDFVQEMGGG